MKPFITRRPDLLPPVLEGTGNKPILALLDYNSILDRYLVQFAQDQVMWIDRSKLVGIRKLQWAYHPPGEIPDD